MYSINTKNNKMKNYLKTPGYMTVVICTTLLKEFHRGKFSSSQLILFIKQKLKAKIKREKK